MGRTPPPPPLVEFALAHETELTYGPLLFTGVLCMIALHCCVKSGPGTWLSARTMWHMALTCTLNAGVLGTLTYFEAWPAWITAKTVSSPLTGEAMPLIPSLTFLFIVGMQSFQAACIIASTSSKKGAVFGLGVAVATFATSGYGLAAGTSAVRFYDGSYPPIFDQKAKINMTALAVPNLAMAVLCLFASAIGRQMAASTLLYVGAAGVLYAGPALNEAPFSTVLTLCYFVVQAFLVVPMITFGLGSTEKYEPLLPLKAPSSSPGVAKRRGVPTQPPRKSPIKSPVKSPLKAKVPSTAVAKSPARKPRTPGLY